MKKIAVITGASSGIGFEMLKMLADPKNGNTILTASRTAEEKLGNYADNVIAFNADTGSKEDIDAIFAKAEEVFDKIDIFIANAGFPYYEKFDYVNYDKIDKIRGMDIIFVTTANTDEEAKELLTLLGAPFAKE